MINRSSVAPAERKKGNDRGGPSTDHVFLRLVLAPVIPKNFKMVVATACMVLWMN